MTTRPFVRDDVGTLSGGSSIDMRSATGPHRNLVLAAMIFAVAMTFIDQTIVSIAVPNIQRELSLHGEQDGQLRREIQVGHTSSHSPRAGTR
jgi:hypothetical protein